MTAPCPDNETLVAFLHDQLEPAEQRALAEHVDHCQACHELVGQLLSDPSEAQGTPGSSRAERNAATHSSHALLAPEASARQADGAPLRPGDSVGRFVVERLLGMGGMGAVHAAYDPDLERNVALKLVRPWHRPGERQGAGEASARLRREAQALAKLSHPNIVPVYEVGEFRDQTYLAMELVEGQTLKDWLAEGPALRALLEVFLEAAEGLSAAHEAGFVHRDFKPSNVMVGADGRVRVLDFGLVRSAADGALAAPGAVSPAASDMTQTGMAVGTPAYMAPEQLRGDVVDARSDQYAFCLCVAEALNRAAGVADAGRPSGARPPTDGASVRGTGPSPGRNRIAVRTGPPWLRSLLRRGLSARPDARFDSMQQLVSVWKAGRQRARRLRTLALLGLGAMAVAAVSVLGARDGATMCASAADEMAGVWDASTRSRVAAAFASQGDLGLQAFDRAAPVIDNYAAAWVDMHTEACAATRIHGTQSEELLDLRVACLASRRGELAALSELFAEGSPTAVRNAAAAALKLSPLDGCADADALRAAVPPPTQPEVVKQVEVLQRRLERAEGLRRTAQYDRALTEARDVVSRASELPYPRLEAQARYVLGYALSETMAGTTAEAELSKAVRLAAVARDDRLAAQVWLRLAWSLKLRAQYLESRALMLAADAALQRIGDPPGMRTEFYCYDAELTLSLGDAQGARERFQKALETGGRLKDDAPLWWPLFALGQISRSDGNYRQAEDYYRRSYDVRVRALGSEHSDVAWPLRGIAVAQYDQQDFDDADRNFAEARRLLSAAFGGTHPHVGEVWLVMSALAVEHGRIDDADDHARSAYEAFEEHLGPDSVDVARALTIRAEAAAARGSCTDARGYATRTIEIMEAKGARNFWLTRAQTALGDCILQAGLAGDAEAVLAQALEIETTAYDTYIRANAEFTYARALWQSDSAAAQRARARELALRAERSFASIQPRGRDRLRQVRAWLEDHPPARER